MNVPICRCLLLVVSALASMTVQAADNRLTPAERDAGWKLLFDGKSFDEVQPPVRLSRGDRR